MESESAILDLRRALLTIESVFYTRRTTSRRFSYRGTTLLRLFWGQGGMVVRCCGRVRACSLGRIVYALSWS